MNRFLLPIGRMFVSASFVLYACTFSGLDFQPRLALEAQDSMTNADVVKMVAAGLSADVIVASIRQAKNRNFDVSANALVELKTKNVPESVILAMMAPTTTSSVARSATLPSSSSERIVLIGGSAATADVQQLVDLLTDFLKSKQVAVKQVDAGSRGGLADKAVQAGAANALYVSMDVGMGQIRDRASVQCVDRDGKTLWEEKAGSTLSFTRTGAAKRLAKSLTKDLERRLGTECLPAGSTKDK